MGVEDGTGVFTGTAAVEECTGVVIGSVVAVIAQAVSKNAASVNEQRMGRIVQVYGAQVDW
jgi:hypothetical protein